jgi:hypothetical protein
VLSSPLPSSPLTVTNPKVNPDLDGEGSSLMRGIGEFYRSGMEHVSTSDTVTSRMNFVGRWRGASRGETVAELETAFVACKADEA